MPNGASNHGTSTGDKDYQWRLTATIATDVSSPRCTSNSGFTQWLIPVTWPLGAGGSNGSPWETTVVAEFPQDLGSHVDIAGIVDCKIPCEHIQWLSPFLSMMFWVLGSTHVALLIHFLPRAPKSLNPIDVVETCCFVARLPGSQATPSQTPQDSIATGHLNHRHKFHIVDHRWTQG